MAVPFLGSLVAFVIALLIGGLAIYVSARLVADVDDYLIQGESPGLQGGRESDTPLYKPRPMPTLGYPL